MKFAVTNLTECGARLGVLSGVDRLPSFTLETPNILIYTKSGSVPHLTPDVLKLLTPTPKAIMISLPSIASIQDRMVETSLTIAEFVGLKDMMTMVTVIDPGTQRLEGFHKKDILSVQTRSGKKEFSAETFMNFVDNLKPDAFTLICDGDTSKDSSKKRLAKSVSRSTTMLSQCLKMFNDGTKNLSKSSLIVPLEGGLDVEARSSYVKNLPASGSLGVVIDGLGQYGAEVEERKVKEYEDAIQASLKGAAADQLRIIHGPWNPRAVLDLIELGVDLMDSTYPHMVTERGCALQLPLQPQIKRAKPTLFEISLQDQMHAESFEPISKECNCYCCKNFTKAYIHHLLNVKEMLASVLLSIHNLQQYQDFFAEIRRAIEQETFQAFKDNFL